MMFVDCFQAVGGVHSVYLSGGATKSPFVCQLFCDAIGLPVRRQTAKELGTLGLVKMMKVALGETDSFDALVSDSYIDYAPDMDRHAQYQALYRRFVATRESVSAHWGEE